MFNGISSFVLILILTQTIFRHPLVGDPRLFSLIEPPRGEPDHGAGIGSEECVILLSRHVGIAISLFSGSAAYRDGVGDTQPAAAILSMLSDALDPSDIASQSPDGAAPLPDLVLQVCNCCSFNYHLYTAFT
jgi:hypothetical protein